MTSGRAGRSARILALLVCGVAGLVAAPPPAPAAAPPAAPGAAGAPPAPRVEREAELPPWSEGEIPRLEALVAAGEKAAAAEDWDAASDRADEAEALLRSWPPEALLNTEVLKLRDRLRALQEQFEEDEEEAGPSAPEDGLRIDTEVAAPPPSTLKAELEQVRAGEKGVEYDVPIDLNEKVLTWIHTFANERKGFIEGSLQRATQYLPMVRRIFQEEGVPQDLAFLAVIESGYKNTAKSRAKAVGMWQFIRSTGRIYGLDGNAWVEERRDPVKATRAAARYLRKLYEREGDWYLALLGYNAGPLTTDRASQALGTRNFWDMARSRFLRNETKNYIPEFCAAVIIGRNPERFGMRFASLRPYVYETVNVDRQTSLNVLARQAGTDASTLQELNPELLRSTTPPGRYQLRVPMGTAAAVTAALGRIPAAARLDFKAYVLKRGDTPARVAARFKVSTSDLLEANDLRPGQFKPGRRIKVPPPAALPIDEMDLLPREERAKVLHEQPLNPLPSIPATPVENGAASGTLQGSPAPAPVPGARIQEIRAQETRAQETRTEGRPPQAGVQEPAPRPQPVEPRHSPRPQEPQARPRFHVVKRGETLFSVAQRYGVEVKDLKAWNRIKGSHIAAGQKLRLHKP